MQHRHRVWQHRLNAAPRGRCKQGMFPLLLCCSLESRCGLRTLGVRLSPCCSIRSHLWLPFAERLLKACENLVALKVSLEHVVSSADARPQGRRPSVEVSYLFWQRRRRPAPALATHHAALREQSRNGRLAGLMWLFGRLFWILPPSHSSLGFFSLF